MDWKARLRDVPVVGTALAVQERYDQDAAGQFAAAMAYFGFLALFPALLLVLAIVGFLLANDPSVHDDVIAAVSRAIPGVGQEVTSVLEVVRDSRAAAGLIGLLGLLFSAFRIVDSATVATSRVFRVEDDANFLLRKGRDLATAVVLGLLLLAGAGAATLAGVDVSGPWRALLSIGGTLVSVLVDTVLFVVAYRLLTASRGPAWRDLVPGAVLAGAVWTALKVVGSTYVASQIEYASAVYGPFATVVGVFVLLYLAARAYLYGAELNAVRCERRDGAATAAEGGAAEPPGEDRSGVTALP